MGRYLLTRLAFALLLVFVVSSSALILTWLAPGDFADQQCVTLSVEECTRLRHRLGLDRPLPEQYVSWMSGAIRFDFGQSMLYSRPVNTLIGERAINTAMLATIALLLATAIGIPLGIYSGTSHGVGRAIVRVLSILGVSVPPLIGSLTLVFIAARTGWLPVGGMTSSAGTDMTWTQWLADLARHIPVPALALAIPMAATLERLQSDAIASASHEPFVAASRARGVDRARSILRHAWPASLRPVLGLYGVMIGSLFSGSFVVEVVTSWPGLGRLMFDALKARDLFLVAGCAATGAFFLAAGTLIADVLLAYTDPRVRSGDHA
ncbi:MAG TPA: ABC transporter permease [Vicinamibacterales bacterium]|nr:ABC transporter permease [Vicinamibacterales bacterium]